MFSEHSIEHSRSLVPRPPVKGNEDSGSWRTSLIYILCTIFLLPIVLQFLRVFFFIVQYLGNWEVFVIRPERNSKVLHGDIVRF